MLRQPIEDKIVTISRAKGILTFSDVLARPTIGRVGDTMGVAGAFIYVASPAPDLVTGTILLVDGGWTAQ